jgi:hypothetical protein
MTLTRVRSAFNSSNVLQVPVYAAVTRTTSDGRVSSLAAEDRVNTEMASVARFISAGEDERVKFMPLSSRGIVV